MKPLAELVAAIPIPLRYNPNRDLDGLTPQQVIDQGHTNCPACRTTLENLAQ